MGCAVQFISHPTGLCAMRPSLYALRYPEDSQLAQICKELVCMTCICRLVSSNNIIILPNHSSCSRSLSIALTIPTLCGKLAKSGGGAPARPSRDSGHPFRHSPRIYLRFDWMTVEVRSFKSRVCSINICWMYKTYNQLLKLNFSKNCACVTIFSRMYTFGGFQIVITSRR